MWYYSKCNDINSHLWDGTEQLIGAGVSVGTRFKAAACEFVISALELSQEDLVVMVGVEQGAYVTGKLVEPGQPHPLLTTTTDSVASFVVLITFFMVQLWKTKDQTQSVLPLCGSTGKLWSKMETHRGGEKM